MTLNNTKFHRLRQSVDQMLSVIEQLSLPTMPVPQFVYLERSNLDLRVVIFQVKRLK